METWNVKRIACIGLATVALCLAGTKIAEHLMLPGNTVSVCYEADGARTETIFSVEGGKISQTTYCLDGTTWSLYYHGDGTYDEVRRTWWGRVIYEEKNKRDIPIEADAA